MVLFERARTCVSVCVCKCLLYTFNNSAPKHTIIKWYALFSYFDYGDIYCAYKYLQHMNKNPFCHKVMGNQRAKTKTKTNIHSVLYRVRFPGGWLRLNNKQTHKYLSQHICSIHWYIDFWIPQKKFTNETDSRNSRNREWDRTMATNSFNKSAMEDETWRQQ